MSVHRFGTINGTAFIDMELVISMADYPSPTKPYTDERELAVIFKDCDKPVFYQVKQNVARNVCQAFTTYKESTFELTTIGGSKTIHLDQVIEVDYQPEKSDIIKRREGTLTIMYHSGVVTTCVIYDDMAKRMLQSFKKYIRQ